MQNAGSLRIVHVLRAPVGGLFRHVRDLSLAHEAAGHKVGVICDAAGTNGYNETMIRDLAPALSLGIRRIKMRREVAPGDLLLAHKFMKTIKELKPDVLHGHGAKGGVYTRAFGSLVRAERSRVARLYSPHGGSLHYDPASMAGKVYFRVECVLERFTDHLLFVAEFERRAYAEKIGEPACPNSVNYNGLQDTEFEPVTPVADAADFLFLGEIRMLKGPDLYVHAVAKLHQHGHENIRAIIVGDGPDRQKIVDLAAELGIESAVSIRPPMPARDAFALARTFVMPSRAEAMPYVVLEALAAGMPVIASDVGGIPEILGQDNPALIDTNTGELERLMEIALREPQKLREWMPDRASMRQKFSVRTMASNALGAYRAALNFRQGKRRDSPAASSVS
jgi:glycosyltransferase involved in cell wall biosynthesis